MVQSNKLIIKEDTKVLRFTNTNCPSAALLFHNLNRSIGCTYMIYMHENLLTNEKRVYTSSWEWQDLLIGEKLINNCPIFLTAFNFLEPRTTGKIFVPWNSALPSNSKERNVCGIREEHNIANGFGYGGKDNQVRETLAFGGNKSDKSFHMNFLADPSIFNKMLVSMRKIILAPQEPLNSQPTIQHKLIPRHEGGII